MQPTSPSSHPTSGPCWAPSHIWASPERCHPIHLCTVHGHAWDFRLPSDKLIVVDCALETVIYKSIEEHTSSRCAGRQVEMQSILQQERVPE